VTKKHRRAAVRVGGMSLRSRFVLPMTGALALVMGIAGLVLYQGASSIAETERRDALADAARMTAEQPVHTTDSSGLKHRSGTEVFPIRFPGGVGEVYRFPRPGGDEDTPPFELLAPSSNGAAGGEMLGMIFGVMVLVILVGAGVAAWIASQVSKPIRETIEDVRQISRGNLRHRTRIHSGGEVALLARTIDRMAGELAEAEDARIELSVREREMELAGAVRDSLHPLTTPTLEGYDIAAIHTPSDRIGGDFHDYLERKDGRVGLLVCDVSGSGVPAALVGATARATLRGALAKVGDVADAFNEANRWLARDVLRGMYVAALYVLLDPKNASATVISAGHKLPLVRLASEDGKLRVVRPDGLALGMDRGPVFERRLEAIEIPMEIGDRLVLCNSAAVELVDPDGQEMGEKGLFGRELAHFGLGGQAYLKALRAELKAFVGDDGSGANGAEDVFFVTVERTN